LAYPAHERQAGPCRHRSISNARRSHADRVGGPARAESAFRGSAIANRAGRDENIHCLVQRKRAGRIFAGWRTGKAGIAHLWFESIHPFEDGNGRLGRAIAEKALAQGLDAPAITALAETTQNRRKDYYTQLQRASLSNRVDEWLDWFSDVAFAAQRRTLDRVHFLLAKARLFHRLRGLLNTRQEKALLRLFAEGPDGFTGGLSAANYRTITDAAPATATRDLAELVELAALRREGQLKHTRYHLNLNE
jgi:hypothetical protein